MKKNSDGKVVNVVRSADFTAGDSVCCTCGKDMPGCWDTACYMCGNTSCYEHSHEYGGKWYCEACYQNYIAR